jgi:hypothetical protein
MSVGVFVDKAHRPTDKEIRESVGHRRALLEDLMQFIADHYKAPKDFVFYGRNYGWAVRFRKRGKALLSIYPQKEFFTVQIILSQSQTEATAHLPLGRKVAEIVKAASRFPEGRWVFIQVRSKRDLADVKRLLSVKAPPRI